MDSRMTTSCQRTSLTSEIELNSEAGGVVGCPEVIRILCRLAGDLRTAFTREFLLAFKNILAPKDQAAHICANPF